MVEISELRQHLITDRKHPSEIVEKMNERQIIAACARCPTLGYGKDRVTDFGKLATIVSVSTNVEDFNRRCDGVHGNPHR